MSEAEQIPSDPVDLPTLATPDTNQGIPVHTLYEFQLRALTRLDLVLSEQLQFISTHF